MLIFFFIRFICLSPNLPFFEFPLQRIPGDGSPHPVLVRIYRHTNTLPGFQDMATRQAPQEALDSLRRGWRQYNFSSAASAHYLEDIPSRFFLFPPSAAMPEPHLRCTDNPIPVRPAYSADTPRAKVQMCIRDSFNDLTGMNNMATRLWDVQSKGNHNVGPKAIGRELVTLFKNYMSEFTFETYILFVGSVSGALRKDPSLTVFGIEDVYKRQVLSYYR